MAHFELYYSSAEGPHCSGRGTLEHAIAHMRKLLPAAGRSYVGLVDGLGTAMQFAGQPDGSVMMDIPCPERLGSWQALLHLDECCRRVENLGVVIDVSAYPDLQFVPWALAEGATG